MKPRLLLAIAALLGLVTVSVPAGGHTAAPPRAPRLIVLLMVDQMRTDYIDQYGAKWTKGLRRLVDRGAWFRQAAFPYLTTVTCAGHATVSTGSFPKVHGMILNEWWDRSSRKKVACTEDPAAPLVSYGPPAIGGNGPASLRTMTFSDELRAYMSPAPRIVSVSLKERTAITLAGHQADVALWLNDEIHSWVTSSAYTQNAVGFIQEFIRSHPLENDYGRSWTEMMPASAYKFEDDATGEQPPAFWNNRFPHLLVTRSGKPDADFYEGWKESPFSNAYLASLAQLAIDRLNLGQGPTTDFLAIGFSALDLVGHDFGPRSHEVQDLLVRLDDTIGSLLAYLDSRVGPQSYTAAFSADHGVATIPEHMAAEGTDAGRVVTNDVVAHVEQALAPLGPGPHVDRMIFTDLYFAPGVYERIVSNSTLLQATIDAIRSFRGVAAVFRADQLAAENETADPALAAARLSYYPGRSGDLAIVPKRDWIIVNAQETAPPGSATTHGTLYPYDARVPVILMGHGIRAGGYEQRATPADIAPTLAALCGFKLSRASGRVLSEALLGTQPPTERGDQRPGR